MNHHDAATRKLLRAMLEVFEDRMAVRAVAASGAAKAREYALDCDAHGNDEGARYWSDCAIRCQSVVQWIDNGRK